MLKAVGFFGKGQKGCKEDQRAIIIKIPFCPQTIWTIWSLNIKRRSLLTSFALISSTTPISCQKGHTQPILAALPNFLSEGVRLGLDKEKARMGHT